MAEIERITESSSRMVAERLSKLPLKLQRNVMRGALRAAGTRIQKYARGLIHSRSGQLKSSIRVSVSSRIKDGYMSARIKAGDPGQQKDAIYWAHFVERGARPHLIVAVDRPMRKTRRGELKAFSIGTVNKMIHRGSLVIGGNLVGPMVKHPGMAGQHFMEKAAQRATPETVGAMAAYINKRLEKEAKS